MKILKVLFLFLGIILINESVKAQSSWFTATPIGVDTVYSILVRPPNDSIYIGTSDSAVYRTTNWGLTFLKANTGFTRNRVFALTSNSSGYMFAGTDSSGVFKSTDNGTSWSFIGPLVNVYSLFVNTSGYTFAGTDNGEIYRSSDMGSSWQLIGSTNYWKVTSFSQNSSYMFCGTLGGGIFRSSDNGSTWIQIVTTTPQISNVKAVHINKRNELFAATTNNGVFKSTDNGNTWLQINTGLSTPASRNVTSLISNRNGDLFAGTNGAGVFRSTDYGNSWSSLISGMSDLHIFSLAVDSFGYLHAGSIGLVYTTNYPCELTTPTLLLPAANADSVSASPLMVWNAVTNIALLPSLYTLQISKDPTFATTQISVTSITDTTYLGSGLEFDTRYYWRVQAFNVSSMSNWSVIRTFKTAIASPDIPVLYLPVNNDTTVSNAPLFTWRRSPRAAKYWFQLALDRNFTVLTREDSTIIDTTTVWGPLVNNTKFFWRVRAKNVGWISDWSSIDSFRTIIPIPGPPAPISPIFGDINIPVTSTFRWTKSPDAATYRLQISADPSYSTFFYNDSTLTDTSAVIAAMANNTTYYWRVNAKNSAGISAFSASYYFTTIISVPVIPVLVRPNNADSNYTTSPTFVWNTSAGASVYQLQLSTSALFTSIINDTTWRSDTTQIVNSLVNGTTYYWRVRAKNFVGLSAFAATRNFKTFTNATVPTSWSYASNTGNNSSISIPLSVNPMIGSAKIKNGDAIGVFFLRNDSMFCAGYTVWNYAANNSMIIWGDNSQTPTKDGFAQNELIRFKIWDSQNKKEYPAQVKLLNGKTSYFMNEYLTVDSLKAATRITHNIQLNQGWNLISTFAQPADSTMDTICAGIRPAMVLLKDGLGRFYWPDFNIRQLPYFDFRQGYQIYMLAPATLTIYGTNVLWDITLVKVIQGWNMISYLKQAPMRLDSALSGIIGKVVLVKNDSGQFFWNEFGINTIGTMKPGIGYQVYMSDSATFSYPYGLVPLGLLSKKQYADFKELAKPAFYKLSSTKGMATSVIVFESSRLADGDEVGVFTLSGKLVGSAVSSDRKAFITMFGDEPITENVIEGAAENEELYIRIKNSSTGNETTIENISVTNAFSFEKSNKLLFKTNSLLKISEGAAVSTPVNFALEQNYPNPFNPTTNIKFSLPAKAKVTLEIYNTLGQIVKKEFDNVEMASGEHHVEFNAGNLASGIYYYRLKTEKYSETKKMLLLR